jgi:hypothetical protein
MVIETQFTKQVKKILTHGAIPTPIGEYLKVSLEQAQLEVGISTPILEASFDNYGCLLTPSWVKKLWEHIWKHNVSLQCPNQALPKLQREGDAFIMENWVESWIFSDEKLVCFNRFRLAYRAMTLADVIPGNGLRVTHDAMSLNLEECPDSKWNWLNKGPCNKDLTRWKEGLQCTTAKGYQLPFVLCLEHWIKLPHLVWQWYYW